MNPGPSLETVFRQSSGAVHAALSRFFGARNLDLVETMMQEAFLKAMDAWPRDGVPENPQGWLVQVAKNQALDRVRRERRFEELQPELESNLSEWLSGYGESPEQDRLVFSTELEDEELRMMFACCHPALAAESQVALILNTLCGFDPRAISRAFLVPEATAAKRLVRAKQCLREEGVSFDFPPPTEVAERLEAVLRTIYLLFTEGYSASSGDNLIKNELCRDALRFAAILARHKLTTGARSRALFALLLFQTARLESRVDAEGTPVVLSEQDRTRWDRGLIDRGLRELSGSGFGEELSDYHLEAAIAACHAMARAWETTDWARIASLYDELARTHPSPVVELNRAIALGMLHGPDIGLSELARLEHAKELTAYHLFQAACGEFHRRAGDFPAAKRRFEAALSLAPTEPERRFLIRRIASLAPA